MAESREVRALRAYLQAAGIPHRVISTCRPGSITNAGYVSRHARDGTDGCGLAVDFAGPIPSRDSDALGAVFWAFKPVFGQLHELIYAGPQTTFNIKAGRKVAKYAVVDHHDHVHVSVNLGVILAAPAAPEEDDMTPEQAKKLDQLVADIAVLKTAVFTGQDKPLGALVAETNERTKRFGLDFGKIKDKLGIV